MKKLFLVVFVLLTLHAGAQQNSSEELRRKVDSLQSLLAEKNYSRIPIGDLDRVLSLQVQTEVYNIFYKFLGVFGLIIFGGGFGLYRSLQSELKKQVADVVDQKNTDIKNLLKEMAEAQVRENNRQDLLIKTLTDNISSILLKQDNFLNEVTANVNKKISDATGTIWNDIADNKIRSAKEAQYLNAQLARELNDFINSEAVKLKMEKKKILIDDLMRCFYYTSDKELKANGFEDKYKEMIGLLNKHESNLELLPATYVNAAIALANNYEFYKNEADKKSCIECCDKALKVLKDYGIAFVLKLEVFMMDYKNAYDQQEKDESLDSTLRILHIMNTNQSPDLHYEAVQRITVDKAIPYLKPYLELLEYECLNEILDLKEKAALSILVTPGWLKDQTHKNLLITLLTEACAAGTNMDGVWRAVKSTDSGVEIALNDLEFEIRITGYNYLFNDGKTASQGYWHYLHYDPFAGISFYSVDNNNKYTVIRALSKADDDGNWTLCMNKNAEERPESFDSTKVNQYNLIELVRVNEMVNAN